MLPLPIISSFTVVLMEFLLVPWRLLVRFTHF